MIEILITGGGYGGIAAAKKLSKALKKRKDLNITIIDKKPFHTLMTELHEIAGHRTEPDSVRIPYAKIFGVSKVKVVIDTVLSIDFNKKQVQSATKSYCYDYLIVGTGAQPNFFGIHGIQENAFTLWSFDDALKLRHHVENAFEKGIAEPNRVKHTRLLTFVIAGAGFTGIELAGELFEWRDTICEKWRTPRNEVRIIIVEAMADILPTFDAELRADVEYYLKKHGVEVLTSTFITGAEAGIVHLKDGSTIETETFIWTAGVDGSAFADSLELSKGPFGKETDQDKKNRRGRLLVNQEMRSVDYPEVYAVGDTIWFTENNKPLPQIVETALQTGETAADNIIAAIQKTKAKAFKPNYHGIMVSVGARYAVSNAMGIKLKGFLAQCMKHMVNLHYLIGIAGINQCWEYIKHEFLDIRTQRSCVYGFGSYKNRGYWLLPLRLWVGLVWVFEGINKIGEGWLSWEAGTKSNWMFSSGVEQAGIRQLDYTEAVTAASDAAEAVEEVVTAASGAAEVVEEVVTAASDAVEAAAEAVGAALPDFHTIWDFTKPIVDINGGLATWFRTTFMDGMMAYIPFQVFQLMIVAVEIGVGLMMIGGLFTWIAALISIGLCLVFTVSGMFEWNKVWFIFTGFLLMGGAGRAFGLDCWVIPAIKKWWNGTRFARKTYLYFDDPSR
ncbi:MAG: NAD(P)/FAD-dependent oxidoreductase [Spirochaetaceae bacterium]|jgi:NADH dehydrogenase|nr:NAD(P)/FAD-dependent oxidoreductase [Spirochaetaceae bacterium]